MSLKIIPVLCNAGFMDNYAYILIDEKTELCAVVDAAEEKAISEKCAEIGAKPSFILTTHHHEDHTNANLSLKKKYHLQIVGPVAEKDKIPGIDLALTDGDFFILGKSKARMITVPGHTLGHCLWYFAADKVLFTGDMLFNLCIGGIFEGTIRQMWQSMQKIKVLPDDVRFYPGHEYTYNSAAYLEKHNNLPEFQKYSEFLQQCRLQKCPPVGNTLELEKQCNPYLRIEDEETFISAMS